MARIRADAINRLLYAEESETLTRAALREGLRTITNFSDATIVFLKQTYLQLDPRGVQFLNGPSLLKGTTMNLPAKTYRSLSLLIRRPVSVRSE
jgi:hypothetical protein